MPGFEVIGAEERAQVDEVFDRGGVLFRHGFDALRNDCYKVRDAKECAAARACVYCRNKWSPSAGNDGVCVERGKQGELPAWAYDCGKKGGGGGASGGDDHSGGDWWPPSSSAAAAEGGA